jgi:hypothetical protein
MATATQAFYCLWQKEAIRERLFDLLSVEDICAVRTASTACCNLVTKRLFLRTNLTFTASTFTKPSRIQALSKIGHHIEHLTFYFAHSDATFLPPLIHPVSGDEIVFLYTPHTSMGSALSRPKYGNSELGDIVTQQFPPLFHAATNVPSFINAMKNMPNIRHLTIKTPGQHPKERYRRDIVDYALISLRITLEKVNFPKLIKLSLSGVHPSAFNYLRPVSGPGCSPAGTRMVHKIRKLYISVVSWDFHGPSPGLDHLKIMDDYIRLFAPTLEKFSFTWLGHRGPCPIALSADPLFAPPKSTQKLFAEVTSPMSPLPPRPARHPLVMPRLRYMAVRNATMNMPQLRDLVVSHRSSVREFDFENVVLANNGNWEEALAPLNDVSGEKWSRHPMEVDKETSSPRPELTRSRSRSGSAVTAPAEDEQLPSPSAAAAAASKELFETDMAAMIFGGPNDMDVFEAGVEEWALGVTAAAQAGPMEMPLPTVPEATENGEEEKLEVATDGGLASDIEAAKEASLAFSTKLKKRVRKKSHRHHHREDGVGSSKDLKSDNSSARSEAGGSSRRDKSKSPHHKHSRSDDTHDRSHSRSRERSHSRHRGDHHRRRQKQHSEEIPDLPSMPDFIAEVLPSDDERSLSRPNTLARKASSTSHKSTITRNDRPVTPPPRITEMAEMPISPPILNSSPLPVLLQATIYDPSSRPGPIINRSISSPSTPPPLVRTSSTRSYNSTATISTHGSSQPATPIDELDDLLSPVQRHIEAELLLEAEERTGALKRAREAVISKLTREFHRRTNTRRGHEKDSPAVMGLSELSALSLGTVIEPSQRPYTRSAGGGLGYRLREGLFGKSVAQGLNKARPEDLGFGAVMDDPTRCSEASLGSAYVPLMFSRG